MNYSKEELEIQMRLIRNHYDDWAVETPQQMKELLDDLCEEDVDLALVDDFYKRNNLDISSDVELLMEGNEEEFAYFANCRVD